MQVRFQPLAVYVSIGWYFVSSPLCIYHTSPDPEKGCKRTVFLRRKFNLRANLLNFSTRIDHLHESRISSNFLASLWASINIFSAKLDNFIALPASHFGRSSLVLIYFMQSFSEWIPDLYFWKTPTLENVFFFVCVCFFFVFVFWAVYEKILPFFKRTPLWDFEKWSDKVACC